MQFYQLHEIVLRMCINSCKVSLKMSKEHRLFALCFEDRLEEYLSNELETWTAILCQTIENKDWDIDILI